VRKASRMKTNWLGRKRSGVGHESKLVELMRPIRHRVVSCFNPTLPNYGHGRGRIDAQQTDGLPREHVP